MFDMKKLSLAAAVVMASNSSFAIQDLDLITEKAVEFASELVVASPATGLGLTNAGFILDVQGEAGFGFPQGRSLYARYDLTGGAEFTAAPVLAATAMNSPWMVDGHTVSAGGAGEEFVIIAFTVGSTVAIAAAAMMPTDDMTLTVNGITVADSSTDVDVIYGLYETASGAGSETGAVATSSAPLITFVSAVKHTITAADVGPVADVEDDFENFTSGGTVGILGTIQLEDTGARGMNGMPVGATNIFGPTSSYVITGDFSSAANDAGTYTGAALARVTLNTDATAAGCAATATAINAAPLTATTATFTAIPAVDTRAVCLTPEGTPAINASAYTVAFNGVAATGYAVAGAAGTLASVSRNGTTVQVPVLTTFVDYNQRFFLVNRGAMAVDYSFAFTSEEGVTAMAGMAASGSLPAGETTSLRATDIVTLTGRTRTAATLTVVSIPAVIDVATQTVNLSTASTDTVVLD